MLATAGDTGTTKLLVPSSLWHRQLTGFVTLLAVKLKLKQRQTHANSSLVDAKTEVLACFKANSACGKKATSDKYILCIIYVPYITYMNHK